MSIVFHSTICQPVRLLAPALPPHPVGLDARADSALSDEIEADVGVHQAAGVRAVDRRDLELGDEQRAVMRDELLRDRRAGAPRSAGCGWLHAAG